MKDEIAVVKAVKDYYKASQSKIIPLSESNCKPVYDFYRGTRKRSVADHYFEGLSANITTELVHCKDIYDYIERIGEKINSLFDSKLGEFMIDYYDAIDHDTISANLGRYISYKLIETKRQGWVHWDVNAPHIESIAEHTIGTLALAKSLFNNFHFDLDQNKVLTMLALHEMEEVSIGDITEFQNITPEEKKARGYIAVRELFEHQPKGLIAILIIDEFEGKKTKEAKFAYMCDKLECDLQAEFYERAGFNHMDNQENNPAFLDERVQTLIAEGNNDVASIFHAFDLPKFKDEEPFVSVMEHIMKR